MMQFDLTATTLRVSLQVREAPIVLVLTVSPPPLTSPGALAWGLKSSYPKLGFGFILSLFATFSVTLRIAMQTNHSHCFKETPLL